MEPDKPSNLLDKITADPGFINRGAAEATEEVVAVSVAVPVTHEAKVPIDPIVLDRDGQHRVPLINLLPVLEVTGRTKPRKLVLLLSGIVVVLGLVVGGWWVWSRSQKTEVAVTTPPPTPRATATPVSSPSLLPSPTQTPVLTPISTPIPETVTVPVVVPTVDHPQSVTIISKSGLWFRSSASSANRSNIIGWMPNGATVSVDAVGDFWWHGTYRGEPGYFASKYTQ